jgi:uncharacterized protein (UPF0147 family)
MISLKKITNFKLKRSGQGIIYDMETINHRLYNDLPLDLDSVPKDIRRADKYTSSYLQNKNKKSKKK